MKKLHLLSSRGYFTSLMYLVLSFILACTVFLSTPTSVSAACSGGTTCPAECTVVWNPPGCSRDCDSLDPYCTPCVRDSVCHVETASCSTGGTGTGQCLAGCSGYFTGNGCSSSPDIPACTVSTSWTAWSACSVACGGGTSSRYNTCSGQTQNVVCNTQACPNPCTTHPDDYWSGWTASGSCGTVTETRHNSCTGATESRTTNTGENCCTWGGWSGCSCGQNQHRTDSCGHYESRYCGDCDDDEPCDPNVWTSWSSCSAACNGLQQRSNCLGTVQTQACNICTNTTTVNSTPTNGACENYSVTQVGNIVTVSTEAVGSTREYSIPNPSFEDGNADFWPVRANISLINTFDCMTDPSFSCADGRWFFAFARDPANNIDTYVTTEFFDAGLGDLSGKTFRFSFMARGAFYPYEIPYVGLQTEPDNGDWQNTSVYAALPTFTVQPQVWQNYSYDVTFPEAPAGYSTSNMRIVLRAPFVNETAYYDNFQLKNVTTVQSVQFYSTPFQAGAGANYCSGTVWTPITPTSFTPAFPPFTDADTWSATWNVAGLGGQKFYVVANVTDSGGNACTGNPSGSCGTAFSVCTGCRQTIDICPTTCNACSAPGEADGCGGTCTQGANYGAPFGNVDIITPQPGANIDPSYYGPDYRYSVNLEYIDPSSPAKADYIEYIIYPTDDTAIANQLVNYVPSTTLQNIETTSNGDVIYDVISYNGSSSYAFTVPASATQGQRLTIKARATNTSCISQPQSWNVANYQLTGRVQGDFIDDDSGNCSNLASPINPGLPNASVRIYRNSSLLGTQVIAGANTYGLNFMPFTPSSDWSLAPGGWGVMSAQLIINNSADLTQAYICSTGPNCQNTGGIQQTNLCTSDYNFCTCTLNYSNHGLLTNTLLPSYSPYDFFLQKYNLSNQAWWQTWGGLVFANGTMDSQGPVAPTIPDSCRQDPNCDPSIVQTSSGPNGSTDPAKNTTAGIPIVGSSGTITAGNDVGGFFTNHPGYFPGYASLRVTHGHNQSGVEVENYDFFANTNDVNVPLRSENNFSTTTVKRLTDGQLNPQTTAAGDKVYYVQGNLNINIDIADVANGGKWNITSDKHVVFVPGNLTIDILNFDPNNNAHQQNLIAVSEGSFLGFIVGGNITIKRDIGYEGTADTIDQEQTPNITGVFVANGNITIEKKGGTYPADRKFIGAGTWVGWTNVVLDREFTDGAGRRELNSVSPTETFQFRPDFVINAPAILLKPQLTWQEVN